MADSHLRGKGLAGAQPKSRDFNKRRQTAWATLSKPSKMPSMMTRRWTRHHASIQGQEIAAIDDRPMEDLQQAKPPAHDKIKTACSRTRRGLLLEVFDGRWARAANFHQKQG